MNAVLLEFECEHWAVHSLMVWYRKVICSFIFTHIIFIQHVHKSMKAQRRVRIFSDQFLTSTCMLSTTLQITPNATQATRKSIIAVFNPSLSPGEHVSCGPSKNLMNTFGPRRTIRSWVWETITFVGIQMANLGRGVIRWIRKSGGNTATLGIYGENVLRKSEVRNMMGLCW